MPAAPDLRLLDRAFRFALRAHCGQRRKGSEHPFIVHPLGVAATVLQLGGDLQMAAAALLHDVLEDTATRPSALRRAFPARVARLVGALTDDARLSWEQRKRLTLEKLERAPQELLLISFADKLENIRAIARDHERLGEAVWPRFQRPRELQRWYYQALERLFRRRLRGAMGPWSREFSRAVELAFRTPGRPARSGRRPKASL